MADRIEFPLSLLFNILGQPEIGMKQVMKRVDPRDSSSGNKSPALRLYMWRKISGHRNLPGIWFYGLTLRKKCYNFNLVFLPYFSGPKYFLCL